MTYLDPVHPAIVKDDLNITYFRYQGRRSASLRRGGDNKNNNNNANEKEDLNPGGDLLAAQEDNYYYSSLYPAKRSISLVWRRY